MSIKIEDYLEREYISDYTGEDIIRDYYVKSKVNDYRISVAYLGAIREDGEVFIECSSGALIEVNEVKYNKHDYLQRIADKVSDIRWNFGSCFISLTHDEVREDITHYNEVDYDSTEDIIRQVIEAIIELDEVKE